MHHSMPSKMRLDIYFRQKSANESTSFVQTIPVSIKHGQIVSVEFGGRVYAVNRGNG